MCSSDLQDYALFGVDGSIRCIDAACPHEGASLAEGDIAGGIVTCPWHGWQFDVCKGCSIDPPGHKVQTYETLLENGRIYIRTGAVAAAAPASPSSDPPIKLNAPTVVQLPLLEVIEETPDVRTFRFDNSQAGLPLDHPGRFAKICVPTAEGNVWRSFTISSSPANPRIVDFTVKLNPSGQASAWLHTTAAPGSRLQLKGPLGGFYFDRQKHREPLVLISAGSGITPMMSIARFLRDTSDPLACTFLHGARTEADIIYHDECRQLAAERPSFRYFVTLTQPGPVWTGPMGRLEPARLAEHIGRLTDCRYFLCGPNGLMEAFAAALRDGGVPQERIHSEQFHTIKSRATAV